MTQSILENPSSSLANTSPYVLSADLADIFTKWGSEKKIFVPCRASLKDVVGKIEHALGGIFDMIHIIDDASITNSFQKACSEVTRPIVSIDRIYMSNVLGDAFTGYLDVTRAVDERFEPVGLIARPKNQAGSAYSVEYLNEAVRRLPESYLGREVTLVDDVVFSGGTIAKIVRALNDRNISVSSVVAGVSIGEAKATLAASGIGLQSAHHFENVIDEVCCRDFIVGAPHGGRTIVVKNDKSTQGNTSLQYAPYLLPFGLPDKWASIPKEKCVSFSLAMLEVSMDLWQNIQDMNGRQISTQQLGCQVFGLPERPSVVTALKEARNSLRQ